MRKHRAAFTWKWPTYLIVTLILPYSVIGKGETTRTSESPSSSQAQGRKLEAQASVAPKIPLCPGLTIVTAINESNGDYESIKTIESVTDIAVRVRASAEVMVRDLLSGDPPALRKIKLTRSVRAEDLRSAQSYLHYFGERMPENIPGTTAITISTTVLRTLKARGETKLGIFSVASLQNSLPEVADPTVGSITRAGVTAVMLPVIVNDVRVALPAIQTHGEFFGEKAEFFFLDDPANPLVLKYSIPNGSDPTADAVANLFGEVKKLLGGGSNTRENRALLQVVKISFRCQSSRPAAPPLTSPGSPAGGGGQAPSGAASALEKSLAETGKADVYSIYFTFNSDAIREESEPTVKEIAEVLRKHPDWRLSVNGHTDNIASDKFNLTLSQKRAAAVKDALVKRYSIDATRLATSGLGESQPKDTNDTLEGRARNRRVELVRQ